MAALDLALAADIASSEQRMLRGIDARADGAANPYHRILDALPQIVWTARPDGWIEYYNRRWYEYTGLTWESSEGLGWQRAMHPDDVTRCLLAWTASLESRAPYEMEIRWLRAGDRTYRWHLVRGVPLAGPDGANSGWFGTCTDIDDQRRLTQGHALLADASRLLSASLDVETTLNSIAKLAIPTLADACFIDLIEDDGALRTAAVAHVDPQKDASAKQSVGTSHRDMGAKSGRAAVVRTGRSNVYPQIPDELYAVITDTELGELYRSLNFRSMLQVPLTTRGRIIGVMSYVYSDSERQFQWSDVDVAEEIARRAALSLDNALAYAREHRVATRLQAASLPQSLPEVPGVAFDAVYTPGKSEAQIGGDWYDAFVLPDGRIALSIGDVIGSGLEAAVTMGKMRQAIRAAAIAMPDPAAVLRAADVTLRMDRADAIVTAMFGLYDSARGTLTCASAGHPGPMLRRPDGTLFEFLTCGLPLGLRDDDEEPPGCVRVPPGSMVTFYTDGLIEATRDLAEGEERLRTALSNEAVIASSRPARAVLESVLVDGARDDVAVMTMTIAPMHVSDDRSILQRSFTTSDSVAATDVRAEFVAFAGANGIGAGELPAVELVLGELIANAVRHAPGPVTVSAQWDALERLIFDVRDHGPGFGLHMRPPDDAMSESGRGLSVIAAFTDEVQVRAAAGGGCVVRAVLAIRRPLLRPKA